MALLILETLSKIMFYISMT